jgi:hypothetical protein
MTRVGVTGHRDLVDSTCRLLSTTIAMELQGFGSLHGISSLAEGADQIFAEQVLEAGGGLTAIIPSADYGASFTTIEAEARYLRLRARADEVIELSFPSPSAEAFWTAGQRVVRLADHLLAVWDGGPSRGIGGTADVVAFAGECRVPTTVIWPLGARRASLPPNAACH